jgi:hypothetical protein
MVTRRVALFDVAGDGNAPVDSPAWCRAVHTENCLLKRQVDGEVRRLKYCLIRFRSNQRYLKLTDRDGEAFATWEDFVQYPEPYGLGMRMDVVNAIMCEADDRRLLRDVVEAVPALAQHGGDRRDQGSDATLPIGRGAPYLIARMKRDAPDFADRLATGEFPSARAAALAAGIIKPPPTWPERLRVAWSHCTPEERASFLADVAPYSQSRRAVAL